MSRFPNINCNTAQIYSQFSSKTLAILSGGWVIFLCGFYFFPNTSKLSTTFYLIVLLPALLITPTLISSRANTLNTLALITLPTLYIALTHFWSKSEHFEPFFFIKQSLFLTFYALATLEIVNKKPTIIINTIKLMIFCGAVNASYGFYHYVESGFHGRLQGINLSSNPNIYSGMHAIICTLCFSLAMESKKHKYKLILLTLSIPSIMIVIFSGSRGSLLAVIVAIILYLVFSKQEKNFHTKAFIMGFFFLIITIFLLNPDVFYTLKTRFISTWTRVDVWTQSLSTWTQNPIFGSGVVRYHYLPVDEVLKFPHSHNLFVDTLRITGVIGLTLVLFQLVIIIKSSVQYYYENATVRIITCWLTTGLLLSLVEGKQPLSRPAPSWLMYWIPLLLLFALVRLNKQRPGVEQKANTIEN